MYSIFTDMNYNDILVTNEDLDMSSILSRNPLKDQYFIPKETRIRIIGIELKNTKKDSYAWLTLAIFKKDNRHLNKNLDVFGRFYITLPGIEHLNELINEDKFQIN